MTVINVHDRLITAIEDTGGTPIVFTAEAWATPDHPSIGGRRENHYYGWHPPFLDGPKALVQLSTAVITERCYALDEAQVHSYLSTIEFLITAAIANIAGGMDPAHALAAAEDELADTPALTAYNELRLLMLEST